MHRFCAFFSWNGGGRGELGPPQSEPGISLMWRCWEQVSHDPVSFCLVLRTAQSHGSWEMSARLMIPTREPFLWVCGTNVCLSGFGAPGELWDPASQVYFSAEIPRRTFFPPAVLGSQVFSLGQWDCGVCKMLDREQWVAESQRCSSSLAVLWVLVREPPCLGAMVAIAIDVRGRSQTQQVPHQLWWSII